MPTTPVPQDKDRIEVLVQMFRFIAAWAADEATRAADCPLSTAEGATARLATARAMCAYWAERMAELVKLWEYQDFKRPELPD